MVQRNSEKLTILYVLGVDFKPDLLDSIKSELDNLAAEVLNIEFIEVTEILPSKSGKPQIVIRE